ncbi:MAG: OprO/OprP family phosphate-selective porin [Allosphingosinicella sp.]
MKIAAALLLTSALAAPAFAQAPAPASAEDIAAELAAMRAKIASLEAQVAALQAAPAAPAPAAAPAPTQIATAAPAAKESADKVTLTPFGRLQVDTGYVSSPRGVSDPGLGWASEIRRARIGVQGKIPGGFGYKIEADFADNDIAVTDAWLSYDVSKSLGLTIGQQNNFQSLEELTSSRFLSFLERAAFTDAFGFERRVGIGASYEAGDLVAQAGIFTDDIDALTADENDSLSLDARLVYAPEIAGTRLHLGGSAHWRDLGDGTNVRYRQRPMVHTTDVRFLATPALGIETETSYGLEAAAIRGPFHFAGEVHWLKAARPAGADPNFFGGYAEAGFYLTGETRAYKGGKFDRTKVLRPVGKGGLGAFQINLRYDYLDLVDGPVVGGRQSGYQASLVWIPQNHVRFLLNYGRMQYEQAPIAAAGGDLDYGVDVFGARAQVDF